MLIEVAHQYQEVKVLKDVITSCFIVQFVQWFKSEGHLHVPRKYKVLTYNTLEKMTLKL